LVTLGALQLQQPCGGCVLLCGRSALLCSPLSLACFCALCLHIRQLLPQVVGHVRVAFCVGLIHIALQFGHSCLEGGALHCGCIMVHARHLRSHFRVSGVTLHMRGLLLICAALHCSKSSVTTLFEVRRRLRDGAAETLHALQARLQIRGLLARSFRA